MKRKLLWESGSPSPLMLNNSQWLSSNQAMGFTKDFNLDALSKLLTDQKAGNCFDKRYALISLKVNKLLQWRYQQLVCTTRSQLL